MLYRPLSHFLGIFVEYLNICHSPAVHEVRVNIGEHACGCHTQCPTVSNSASVTQCQTVPLSHSVKQCQCHTVSCGAVCPSVPVSHSVKQCHRVQCVPVSHSVTSRSVSVPRSGRQDRVGHTLNICFFALPHY